MSSVSNLAKACCADRMLSHAEDCACAGDIDVARAARHANGAGFTINPHDQIVLDQGKGTVVAFHDHSRNGFIAECHRHLIAGTC